MNWLKLKRIQKGLCKINGISEIFWGAFYLYCRNLCQWILTNSTLWGWFCILRPLFPAWLSGKRFDFMQNYACRAAKNTKLMKVFERDFL